MTTNKIVYNDPSAKYIKTKLNDLETKINNIVGDKLTVIVLYNKQVFPEIEYTVQFAGGVNELYDFSGNTPEETVNKFKTKVQQICDTYITEVALLAGMYSDEAFNAQEIIGEEHPNIHLMTGGAYPGTDLKALRATQTYEIGAEALMIFARLYRKTKLQIVRFENRYGRIVSNLIRQVLDPQEIILISDDIIYDPLLDPPIINIDSDTVLFMTVDGVSCVNLIKANINNFEDGSLIVGSDFTALTYDSSTITQTNPPKKIYMMIPAANDITQTTKDLYQYIYDNWSYHYTKNILPNVIFIYDIITRAKLVTKFEDIVNIIDNNRPAAGLPSSTYSGVYGSPLFGGYWFMQGIHYSGNIAALRQATVGSFPSLVDSIYPELDIGHFSWAGQFKWNIYYNPFEESVINTTHVRRFKYQETVNFNWSNILIPLSQTSTGKWMIQTHNAKYPLNKEPVDVVIYGEVPI